jgi:hypothetical protein
VLRSEPVDSAVPTTPRPLRNERRLTTFGDGDSLSPAVGMVAADDTLAGRFLLAIFTLRFLSELTIAEAVGSTLKGG